MTTLSFDLEKTITAGLEYILSMQAENGSWTEWALPPGSSLAWTTAYVGYMLRHLPLELAAMADSPIAAAARWLSANACADFGWGYNEAAGSDGDSTSYAILFLASAGLPVPDAAYTLLANLQSADGGFSTYLPFGEPNSWNVSHPDVTPIALLALLTQPVPGHRLIERGIDYVLHHQNSPGLWNSFWWDSCLYGTAANRSLLNALGIEIPSSPALSQIKPTNAFETALLTSSLLDMNHGSPSPGMIRELAASLNRQQQPNGCWDTAPILRITRRDCYEPWASSDAGQLYAEPNRLFTTATVLNALTKVLVLFKE